MLKFSLTAMIALASASAAAAQQPPIVVDGAPTAHVSYADLNLQTSEGRQALDGRIRRAAKELCIETGVVTLNRVMMGRKCLAEAIASARPQIKLAKGGLDNSSASGERIALRIGR